MSGYDAIFFDGADEWMEQGAHTWAVASNVPKGVTTQMALKVLRDAVSYVLFSWVRFDAAGS